jgi:tetratricopeptide (TPR) repeat protein
VPGYTRHQLKHDRLTDATKDTVSWAVDHQKKLVAAGVIILLLAGGIAGGWYYLDRQNDQASVALGAAVRVFQRPIRAVGVAPQPEFPSYASLTERGRDAEKLFLAVADQYPYTRSGEIARYLAGAAAVEAGDNATAERELKAAAGSRREDLAALAKMALASFYRSSHRDAEALPLYDQLIDHPTASVSKAAALLAKAELLEKSQPGEATKVYQQLRAEDPKGQIGRLAEDRLSKVGK